VRRNQAEAFDVYEDDDFGPAADRRPADGLRRIARYQRWLVSVVLAQLVLWGAVVLLWLLSSGRWSFSPNFPMTLTLILGAVGGVYVFLSYYEVRGSGAFAVLFGLLTVVPVLGLLILTMTNGYSTSELRKHGVTVGLFGASEKDIPDEPSLYDIDEDTGW
jgi:hypothetical protein